MEQEDQVPTEGDEFQAIKGVLEVVKNNNREVQKVAEANFTEKRKK